MQLRLMVTVLAAAATISWAMPARAQTLVLYDDFSSGELDRLRWWGYDYVIDGTSDSRRRLIGGYNDEPEPDGISSHGPNAAVESVRRVVDGQAQVSVTAYKVGGVPREMTSGRGRSGLRLNRPALADHTPVVRTFRASVTVADVTAEPPGPGTRCGWQNAARVQVFGHFFNDGSSQGPGDLAGDIFAAVSLERRVESTSTGPVVRDVAEARVGRCISGHCEFITWSATPFTRGWTPGAAHVLTINWRPAANAFVFTVSGGGIPAESRTVTYVQADALPPRGYAYDLRAEVQPGLCDGDGQSIPQRASIDARFDNVYLDTAAAAAR
jgi:hypothetical protein